MAQRCLIEGCISNLQPSIGTWVHYKHEGTIRMVVATDARHLSKQASVFLEFARSAYGCDLQSRKKKLGITFYTNPVLTFPVKSKEHSFK